MQTKELKFTNTHEWIKAAGELVTIGITDHAESELGDIVYLELPRVGTTVRAGEAFGAIESVKTVSDLVAPASGEIVEVNEELPETPELVNEDPYGAGWMVIIKLEDPNEIAHLMNEEEYEEFVQEH
ncbi:MAG TPA: glycine cleavage system protein GcvH [Armatimonadota bacterium]|nr:glycine cleavage system protein GcvH [Armatimonadota bacterium]